MFPNLESYFYSLFYTFGFLIVLRFFIFIELNRAIKKKDKLLANLLANGATEPSPQPEAQTNPKPNHNKPLVKKAPAKGWMVLNGPLVGFGINIEEAYRDVMLRGKMADEQTMSLLRNSNRSIPSTYKYNS